jgi:hypothetical protein
LIGLIRDIWAKAGVHISKKDEHTLINVSNEGNGNEI